jgi:hypothetical protein
MTYLQIVNGVLRRLREDSVAGVQATTYSKMVGDFVNDAKHLIEGTWDWGANRQDVTVTTVASTLLYSLTGVGQDPEVHKAWNTTNLAALKQMTPGYYKNLSNTLVIPEGRPEAWSFAGPDSSDDTQINIYPTPDAVYSLTFWVSAYQADLSADGDVLNIPSLPVILQTVAMLAEEKGETGGYTSARYFEMADKALSDAIAYDAAHYSVETEWTET